MRRVIVLLAVLAILPALRPCAPALAGPPTYTFDVDPIRLGTKALEEGRLGDARARFEEAAAAGYQVSRARFGLAEVALREGRFDAAEALYRQVIEERRADEKGAVFSEARAGLGLLLLRKGKEQEAAPEFERALNEKPDCWPALYGQARLAMARGDLDGAARLLERGAKRKGLSEGEDRYHFGMALLLLERGDLDGAEVEGLLALDMNPADPEYGPLLARVYERKGVPALAIDAYEKAMAAPGTTPTAPVLHNLGRLYQDVRRYNDARDAYLRAVTLDSTYTPALKDLARLYRLADQNDRAAQVYLRYLQVEPGDIEALLDLAAACGEIRQPGPALEAARKAMALDSTRTDVRLAFARAGLQSADAATRTRAAGIYRSLPDSLRRSPGDELQAAAALMEAKQYPLAAESLARVLKMDPRQPEAHFQLGMIELGNARPDSAVARFEEAARLNPGSALYHLNLGIARLQARRVREAIPAFRRALELNSDLTVGRVLLGQALAVSDSLAAAETEYRKVLEVEPANAKALRGLGFCYIRRARYRDAARVYQAAADAEPGNADGWAGLGNAQLGLQNWSAAEEAFRRARAIDPANPTMKKGLELLENARKAGGG